MSEQSPPITPDPFAGPPSGSASWPAEPVQPGYAPPARSTTPDDDEPYRTSAESSRGSDDGGDSSAKERAADTAEAGRQAAGDVASTATDKAQDVAAEAKTQASNLVSQTRDELQQQAAAQHRRTVDNLHALADELQSMAHNSEQSGPATDLVAQAGARAKSAAVWMDDRDPAQLVEELRGFARRRPGAFVLGALAAGVLAGRLTRGVVAGHQDDSPSGSGSAPAELSTPRSAPRHAEPADSAHEIAEGHL